MRDDQAKWAKPSVRLAVLMLLLAAVLSAGLSACKGSKAPVTEQELRGGETRATLSPSSFTGATAEAYRIAGEIPAVLDSLHCYCECKKHFGHKSLLTCYVDDHAEHCDICQDEAFMAYELYKQGKDIPAIRSAVDARFARQ